jgi:glycosyltransferase family protein
MVQKGINNMQDFKLTIIKKMRAVKGFIYYLLGLLYFKIKKLNVKILSIEDTISNAKYRSVIRFGDGEIALINGKNIVYQESSQELSDSLLNIINDRDGDVLICLPDIFENIERYNFKDRYFHIKLLFYYRKFFHKFVNGNSYGNTFMSRPYMIFKDKSRSSEYFNELKGLWDNKEIVIVEGHKSRSGVGNTLFDNAKKIERIICPSENAYNKYQDIIDVITKMDPSKLYLFALGPTAKIVIYQIAKHGFHAIDIGHLDSEYEWSLRSAKNKIKIDGKHTAEFKDEAIGEELKDPTYINQIIKYV